MADFSFKSSKPATTTSTILRWQLENPPQKIEDHLVVEEPLEIRVRSQAIAVTMRTPGHDHELAIGFLLSEGLIHHRDEITEIAYCQRGEASETQNILNVFLSPSVKIDFAQLTRHVFASSSCGICGKSTIESVHQHFPPVESNSTFSPELLISLPARLRAAQETFDRTGGLHAAAIFDQEGNLIVLREDIGRHNAVDKVIGHGFLNNPFPFSSHILLVSGRASFEIMQKALAARIQIVASISAPSDLAVNFAKESNQTLIGFLRGEQFNIYSSPERLKSPSTNSPSKLPQEALYSCEI